MPYIVCVNLPGYLPEQSPTATATIEEARQLAHDQIGLTFAALPLDAEWSAPHFRVEDIPEQGGVIGPLPDGYVIDVQHKTYGQIAALIGPTMAQATNHPTPSVRPSRQEIIDAYNEQG